MDYESLKLDYYSGCQFTHTYSLGGTLTPSNKVIEMIPAKEFNVNNSYDGKLSHDYIQLLPKFALQYDFDSRNNIYASVSKGYRSGGYNIQMFSDLLQNDMQASMMKDVAGVTIPALESAPIKDEYLRYPLRFMKKRPLFTREGRRIRRKPASQDPQKKGEGNH